MFTRISSLALAILLAVLLWAGIKNSEPNFYLLAVSIVVLIFASFAVNFKRLNFTWPHLLLPTIYLLAVGSVFAILPVRREQIVFLVFAAVVFYFLEIRIGRESHFLQNVYLLSSFAIFLGLFALEFYFNPKLWWLLPLVFLTTYVLAVQGLAGFSLPAKKYFYTLIALACTEAAWGLIFWPTHFFVNAVVLFCLFYILWLFSFSAFFGKLSRAKIYWQLTLIAIVLVLTLSTAAWGPLR